MCCSTTRPLRDDEALPVRKHREVAAGAGEEEEGEVRVCVEFACMCGVCVYVCVCVLGCRG